MIDYDADVIILGAGPAGCAAAIAACQAGLQTIVLEASPRSKITPGETLHPGIEPLLEKLGVASSVLTAGFHRHRGIWFIQNDDRRFIPYGQDENGPWLGFQVDRKIFHEILRQQAVQSGAILNCAVTLKEPLVSKGKVVGVAACDHKNYRSRWVIDATGRSAWLAHKLNLKLEKRSPLLRAKFGWRDNSAVSYNSQPMFTFCDRGWNWEAPLSDSRIAWVGLRTRAANGKIPSGTDLTWRFCRDCAGPGYFLIGDAAALLDPASSHGVLRAIMSGMLAIHLLKNCLSCSKDLFNETMVSKAYHELMQQQFEHEEMRLLELYKNTPIWPEFEQFLRKKNDIWSRTHQSDRLAAV